MIWKNFLRRALIAVLSVIFLLSAALVGAAVQIFDGYGECEMGEFTTLPKAKERALERAKLDAQKQAGLYLKTESRSINSELVDEAISAVTNNIIEISGVQYETITQKITERTTAVVIVAKLKASIDPNGIYDWLKRDEKEKVTIIQQNDGLQDAIKKNDKEFEDLKEKYKSATSQAEKDRIIKQMEQVDRDFLANQKFEEALKLYYAKDYYGAIKLFNESLDINPNNVRAYWGQSIGYYFSTQYEQVIKDFDKDVQLNPNNAVVYNNRGCVYWWLEQYNMALKDFNKAIELNPNYSNAYVNRGNIYKNINQYDMAIKDFNKAIQANSNNMLAHFNRGISYENLKQYELAIQDYNKVIQLSSDFATAYLLRGWCYQKLSKDADEKAQEDFKKAKELGYNG